MESLSPRQWENKNDDALETSRENIDGEKKKMTAAATTKTATTTTATIATAVTTTATTTTNSIELDLSTTWCFMPKQI